MIAGIALFFLSMVVFVALGVGGKCIAYSFGVVSIYVIICLIRGIFKDVSDGKTSARISTGDYRTPYEYERYVAGWLSSHGYKRIQVTQKSGDYGADIICYNKKGAKIAVQCKMYSKPVGYRAVEEVLGAMHYYGCNAAMVVTNNTYTRQAIDAANRVGVHLIQRVI